jgi:signal transduction histidine kinase
MTQLSLAEPATSESGSGAPAGPAAAGGREGPPLALHNWRVTWRLVALIVLPTVAGMVFAGLRVGVAEGNAHTFSRVERLAALSQQVTALAQAMEDERDSTAMFIGAGRPGGGMSVLQRQYAVTNGLAAEVAGAVGAVSGGDFPAQTKAAAAAVTARIADLRDLRSYAGQGNAPAGVVINDYSLALSDLFTLDDEIAQEGGDASLIAKVRTLGSLSRMKDQASQQRAILGAAFAEKSFEPGALAALAAAQAQQGSDLASFDTSATLGESQAFANTVAGTQVDQAQTLESGAIVTGTSGGQLDPALSHPWYVAMSGTVDRMRTAEEQLVSSIVRQARQLHQGAAGSARLTAVAALVVVLVVLLITVIIAQSLVRPLRRLKAGALDVAEVGLPAEVRKLSAAGGDTPSTEVTPIDVHSTDEIGQVARAFDQVHREALRLAADEAALRGSVSAMFVSLSRRSQSLLERLLRLIDSLELGEEDPERLSNLFRMDHLATRMRRNSENLLVLAGHETPRRQSGPVPLLDVVRAAVSEIEQYDRVSIDVQQGVSVTGNAVTDTVHLLAELLENATMFSAKTTQVTVSAHTLSSGAILLGVTDSGMGMSGDQLAQLNWRLENPPVADVAVSRHMGLFAVSHLASRHGIKVGLQKPAMGGITAHVLVPDRLTAQDTTAVAWRQSPPARVPAAATAPLTMPRASRGPQAQARARAALPPPPAPAPSPPPAPPAPPPMVIPEPPVATTLPIFESVESDWFRARGRRMPRHEEPARSPAAPSRAPSPAGRPPAVPLAGRPAAPSPAAPSPQGRPWSSPGDDGWRAAETVLSPVTGGVTPAGLPRRTPQANLVPGSAGERTARPAKPAESAEVARNRLAGFQRGSRRGRDAVVPANRGPDQAS